VAKNTQQNQQSKPCIEAARSEQDLCLLALESGEFDTMTDDEWVLLCERIAKEVNNAAGSGTGSDGNVGARAASSPKSRHS